MLLGIVLPSLFFEACYSAMREGLVKMSLRPPRCLPNRFYRNVIFPCFLCVWKMAGRKLRWVNRRPLTPYGGLKAQPGRLRG